ncbi:DUF2461 domain-containing protein [Nocardioides baekrokdamisoli]|uniref:DUF2461 domain-containing protein n=1 Tax=Nocardioides baekrokdamisoli TaxID=1804624 RepID=UPI000F767170|nr:DUF2461 domain-containing protein [Nocardioides baekrokdamisoli]
MTFSGIPIAALDFYDDLEQDNTKTFWEAHKHVYQESVLEPMKALTGALAEEFGSAKIFRPYRDVRFAKDKTPYKTAQGAFVGVAPETGFYVQISAAGVRTGAGSYHLEPTRLAHFRADVANELRGPELERILAELGAYEIGGETLKTTPKGYDKEHPRLELLRHKSLTAGRNLGFEAVIHTPELLDVVRADWQSLTPLVEWLSR